MKNLVLQIEDKEIKDGTIFRIRNNKYRVNFSKAGHDHNIDLWDYQAEKPLSIIGTIKSNGSTEFNDMLFDIDEILKK